MSSNSLNLASASSGSGLDVDSVVSAMIEAERAPERIWQAQQNLLQAQASALNTIQSRLNSLDTSVSNLRDVLGVFSQNSVTTSDASVLTATADSSATAASHTVKVTSLATNASYYTNAIPAGTTLTSGSFTLKVGSADAKTVTIDSTTNTLDKLAKYINGLGLDLNATVLTDASGTRLAIAGTKTGKANDVQLSAVSGFTFTTGSTADNAKLTVDGIPVETSTNTVSGVIPGVTLNLNNVSSSQSVALSVTPDTNRVKQAAQDFVNSYNSLITNLNAQFTYDSVNKTSGLLSGDSTVRTLQETLLGSVGYSSSNNDAISSLSSIGVTMNNDGTLTFDSDKFTGLAKSNFAGLKTFFQGSGDGTTGFANYLGDMLDRLNDSTTGAIVVDLKGNADSQTSLTKQIDAFEVRIADRREQLLNQYSQVDAILRQFPLQQSQVTAALNSLANMK